MSNTEIPLAAGVYAALVTPRRQNSREADTATLLDYVDSVARAGVHGFVLFGSTGEFVHFEIEERIRVLALAVRRSRVPVLVNVSHSTFVGACELAESAISAGAAGLLLMPPHFYRYTDAQIFAFYEQFLKVASGGVPVYLYNLPFFTNPLSPDLLGRLLHTSAFAGIKDSSGDWDLFEHLLRLRRETSFQLLAGNESIYWRALQKEADGTVSGIAAAIPELLVAIHESKRASDLDRGEALNSRLQQFVSWLGRFPSTFGIRQAAAARGWIPDEPAVPVDERTSALRDQYGTWLKNWIPAVLDECASRPTGSIVIR